MGLKEDLKNPRIGLVGINKLYEKYKSEGYSRDDIKNALEKNTTYQLHKEIKPVFQRIWIEEPFKHYQIDLVDMSKYASKNKGYSWILNMIDIFSKQAYSVALKSKNEGEVLAAARRLIEENHLKPQVIQSDNGSEFVNKKMKKYLSEIGAYQIVSKSYSPQTNGGIERFNRTIKSMIFKLFTLNDNFEWVNFLDDLMYNYNHSYHRMIKMNPNDVKEKNKLEVLQNLKDSRFDPKITNDLQFKINDYVRIKIPKEKLDKKIDQTYSNELYRVDWILDGIPGLVYDSYYLRNSDGKRVKGSWIYPQLQKVIKIKKAPNTKAEHEKVMKDARRLAIEMKTDRITQEQNIEKVKKGEKPIVPINLESKRPKREAKPTKKFLESIEQS